MSHNVMSASNANLSKSDHTDLKMYSRNIRNPLGKSTATDYNLGSTHVLSSGVLPPIISDQSPELVNRFTQRPKSSNIQARVPR